MQISIAFKKDKIKLPIAACETIQGLIYRAISEDQSYSAVVHDEGNVVDGRRFKLFTFGELKGKYLAENGNITYFSKVELEIRSADEYFLQLLLLYFSSRRFVRLGDNDVEVGAVRLKNATIFDDKVTVRTLSPVTAYITEPDGHTVYFSPEDPRFCSAVVANAKRKWVSCFANEEMIGFEISPCEGARFIKRATRFKHTFITAWHGSFVLKGAPKVIDFLYNTGLGSKNSQGFGMFEVIKRGQT